ncbi:MAG: hypothetical protein RMY34_27770 [Aulosira sp. DedQUE10]|nr:hypothetical protein [Aulosira sp. DedQUE10]
MVRFAQSMNLSQQRLHEKQVSEQQWAISVIDSGIGIPLDTQTQIFNPYFRAVSNKELQVPLS